MSGTPCWPMLVRAPAGRKRRALLFPLGVLALGVLLMFVGPLPGLGLMLCIGGLFARPIIAIKVWLSP